MPVDKCARHILKGVARKKCEIVITPHARLMYRMQRWFPGLVQRIGVREMRKARLRNRTQLADGD